MATTEDNTQLVDVDIVKDINSRRNASLIVISGNHVGQMYRVDQDMMVIGRAVDATIRLDDDGVSRNHAQVRRQNNDEIILQDLGSTNGTYCNGERISTKVLQDGDRLQIGTNSILKFSFQDDVEEEFQKRLFNSAIRDGLTGCYNKKYFDERLHTEFAYAMRHNVHLSLIIFDLDHFKQINDTHGHPAGDMVLQDLAKLVFKTIRTEDIFARYGGEEFAVVLRETGWESAFIAAERIRRAVKNYRFDFYNTNIAVTISLGLATFIDGKPMTVEKLLMKADEYLYKAKQGGRNTTECEMFD